MNLPVMPAVLELDADAWALRINARWRSSIESIFETGQLLIDAKGRLPHGEFGQMLETKLAFRPRQAQMLMAIAADARLSNPQYIAHLPASWGSLYDLSRLSDDQIKTGIKNNIIRPDMERADIARLRSPSSDGGVESRHTRLVDDPRPLENGTAEGDGPAGSESALQVGRPTNEAAGVASGPSEPHMPSGGLAIAHSRQEPADSLDFFPTPPWATRALFEHVLAHLGRKGHCQFQTAWEPACGEGHMAFVMGEYFKRVYASDLVDYGYGEGDSDFLTSAAPVIFDWIITNPPFNTSTEFVLKAIAKAGTGVAMFVRLSWLESVGRYEKIFRDHPPTLISIFAERVPLHKGRWEEDGTTMTAYTWLVWIKGAEPRAPFWIPPGCREALTKKDDGKRFGKKTPPHDPETGEIIEYPEEASGTAREAPSTGSGTSSDVGTESAPPHLSKTEAA